MGKTAIYSVLVGEYDEFRGQEYYDPDCDYYLFTDQDIQHDRYRVVNPFVGALKLLAKHSRYLKIKPTTGYLRTVYHDANITLHKPIYEYVHSDKFCVLRHPTRTNVWEEFAQCIEMGKDSEDVLIMQRNAYAFRKDYNGMDLCACGVLMRNNSYDLEMFNNRWWAEVRKYSHRDQLSFYYANPPVHEKIPWDNKYFSIRNHK